MTLFLFCHSVAFLQRVASLPWLVSPLYKTAPPWPNEIITYCKSCIFLCRNHWPICTQYPGVSQLMTHKILYVPKYLILLCNVAQRWATFSNENNGLTTHNILCLAPGRTQHLVAKFLSSNRFAQLLSFVLDKLGLSCRAWLASVIWFWRGAFFVHKTPSLHHSLHHSIGGTAKQSCAGARSHATWWRSCRPGRNFVAPGWNKITLRKNLGKSTAYCVTSAGTHGPRGRYQLPVYESDPRLGFWIHIPVRGHEYTRPPRYLDIKKPSSAGRGLLYFCFLGIFFFLFGIICCFFAHRGRITGFIGFILFIFFYPSASPAYYWWFVWFLFPFYWILYTFVYLGHKLSVFPKKKKREKRKTRIYITFLTPLSIHKMHRCVIFLDWQIQHFTNAWICGKIYSWWVKSNDMGLC